MHDACQEIIANHKLNELLLDWKKNPKPNEFLKPFKNFMTENSIHGEYECSLLYMMEWNIQQNGLLLRWLGGVDRLFYTKTYIGRVFNSTCYPLKQTYSNWKFWNQPLSRYPQSSCRIDKFFLSRKLGLSYQDWDLIQGWILTDHH